MLSWFYLSYLLIFKIILKTCNWQKLWNDQLSDHRCDIHLTKMQFLFWRSKGRQRKKSYIYIYIGSLKWRDLMAHSRNGTSERVALSCNGLSVRDFKHTAVGERDFLSLQWNNWWTAELCRAALTPPPQKDKRRKYDEIHLLLAGYVVVISSGSWDLVAAAHQLSFGLRLQSCVSSRLNHRETLDYSWM